MRIAQRLRVPTHCFRRRRCAGMSRSELSPDRGSRGSSGPRSSPRDLARSEKKPQGCCPRAGPPPVTAQPWLREYERPRNRPGLVAQSERWWARVDLARACKWAPQQRQPRGTGLRRRRSERDRLGNSAHMRGLVPPRDWMLMNASEPVGQSSAPPPHLHSRGLFASAAGSETEARKTAEPPRVSMASPNYLNCAARSFTKKRARAITIN